MTRELRIGLTWLLLSSLVLAACGLTLELHSSGAMADFKAVFYGSRCILDHKDPYKEADFLEVLQSEKGTFPSDPKASELFRRAVPLCVNLPTALVLAIPLALMPFGTAQAIWTGICLSSLIIASCLAWDLARSNAPWTSLFLACTVLSNSEVLLMLGNISSLIIGLCVIGTWSILRNRLVTLGLLCFALSLAIKPQGVIFIALYFALLSGTPRKLVSKAVAIATIIGLLSLVVISKASPNWRRELRSNIQMTSEPGNLSDPGPNSLGMKGATMIIDLQTVTSIYSDNPTIYNGIAYAICGVPFLLFVITSIRTRANFHSAPILLAGVSALSMLPIYHRQYDARILLLALPGCALLWSKGKLLGKLAFSVTFLCILATGDISIACLHYVTRNLSSAAADMRGNALLLVVNRPAPFCLHAMSVFFLCVSARESYRTLPGKIGNGEGT
jgi:hypothetical protein